MATKINYLDCNQARMGTGVLSCEVQTGVPIGFFLVAKSWRFDPASETFDNDYIEGEIKKKTMIPFLNASGFEFLDEEAEIFTSNLKIQSKVMDGLPGFSFDYQKGPGFHKAAYSFNSFGNYNVLLVYNNGVIDGALDAEGKILGYNAGRVNTGNYQLANGSDPQKTAIAFQLIDAYQFNVERALISASANGFSLSAIGGIIDLQITKESNTTADVVISVFAKNNSAIAITGLTDIDFIASGTTETISSVTYDAASKQYTLTFSGDVSADYADLVISLYDAVDTTYVVKKGVNLYQGDSNF